jgi:hypothetical protein
MSLSWWMWLGAVAVLGAALGGLHWTLLDFLMDRIGTRAGSLRDRESEPPGTAATPQS